MNILKSTWQKTTSVRLAAAFIMLNVADGAMTRALSEFGGVELSPIWKHFLANTTVSEFVVTKIVFSIIICGILLLFSLSYPNKMKRIMAGLVVGMVVVFTINAINLGAFFAGLVA